VGRILAAVAGVMSPFFYLEFIIAAAAAAAIDGLLLLMLHLKAGRNTDTRCFARPGEVQ